MCQANELLAFVLPMRNENRLPFIHHMALSLARSYCGSIVPSNFAPQWGTADAEIKVPPNENKELKRSPFKAWSRSVYSHTCFVYCQGFLPCVFLPSGPFTCTFSKTSPNFSPVLALAKTGFSVGPQNKIGHSARCKFKLSARGI